MSKGLKFPLDIQYFAEGDPKPPEIKEPETPEPETKTVSKVQFDKAASELAETKKKLKALEEKHLTEEERRQLENQEKEAEIEMLKAEIAKEKVLATLTAKGIDPKKAQEIADKGTSVEVALEIASLFAETSETHKREIEQAKLDNMTKPNGGGEDKPATKTDFRKMSLDERAELKRSDRVLYDQISK